MGLVFNKETLEIDAPCCCYDAKHLGHPYCNPVPQEIWEMLAKGEIQRRVVDASKKRYAWYYLPKVKYLEPLAFNPMPREYAVQASSGGELLVPAYVPYKDVGLIVTLSSNPHKIEWRVTHTPTTKLVAVGDLLFNYAKPELAQVAIRMLIGIADWTQTDLASIVASSGMTSDAFKAEIAKRHKAVFSA